MASTSTTAPAGRDTRLATGIVCVCLSVLAFSSYNALGKWLAADYSPWQIMFFRGLFSALPFAAYALATAGLGTLRSRQPGLQVARAVFGFASNVLFIFSYREMPLADAVAIGYAAPVFIVVLSVPLLSEHVGVQRASAAIVGFIGVVMTAQPGVGVFSPGALYALAGTLCYALLIVTTRRLGAIDSTLCTAVYSSAGYALGGALPLLAGNQWATPEGAGYALFAATALLGGAGMILFTTAYRHAPAAVLAPFDYAAMLWAAIFGFLIWGEIPGPWAVAGMAVISASGLFLMRHERLRRFRQDKP